MTANPFRDVISQTVEAALLNPAQECDLYLNVVEQQGEAIMVQDSGIGFYTLSEGVNEPIYFYNFI